MSRFVHLHTHSHFSLLEALPKIEDLIGHVKENGMDTVALTDNGVLYGAMEFYQTAKQENVKPIIGVDFYLTRDGRHLKRPRIDTKPFRLVCLAQNEEGYRNLIHLSSIGFLEGFYYKPRIDFEVLKNHTKGLITLSGGHLGEIGEAIRKGEHPEKLIQEYVGLFGEGNFYLELVDRPEIAEQESMNAQLIELGKVLGVPTVATKNTFYLKPRDVEAWKVSNCIKSGRTLEHFERMNPYDFDASMVSAAYMEERFADVPEAIENTRKIADRCQLELELGKWNFPKYEIPECETFRSVLTKRAFEQLSEKEGEFTDVMRERLNYELDIIDQKGFCPYFLIVSDFINWARANGIMTTTRGSVAGSLVSYAIGISSINPLTYELPFERFLNPQRPSAPDIDADFADNRRDDVFEYVRGKYGQEKVAQICTFGTMLARGSVRDVGRVLGFQYSFVDEIAKLVPMGSQGFPMTLDRALNESSDLKKKHDTDANVRRIIDLAKRIEGCARHVSIHAAGAVIAPTNLTDFTPLQIDTKEGKIITQYEMHAVETAGLIKIDFLGIRNLSILGDAIALVKKLKGIDIQVDCIPIRDKKTFELLTKGHTMGVFQLNGEGMTKYLMELKPERVEDLMAMVALYRPGPIESIPEYIERKHNPSLISFLDPRMELFLKKSYGLLVYQDDVLLTAIHLAGYSWLEADKLRKAMGKKIPEEMAMQKIKLLEGFVSHGLSEEMARQLWKLIEPFAAYGFCKGHAASYGMVAYQTAYMKANYPAEYMTALMTAESGDLEKIAEAVHECERLGIAVFSPDINESRTDFTYISDTQIRFGLLVIKNLGAEVVEAIIAERKRNGQFKDLSDFAGRITHHAFNKKSLEALIKAGALDRFGERRQLLENVDRILLYNKMVQRERESHQQSLFASSPTVMTASVVLRASASASMQEMLAWEKEMLGLYITAHPFEKSAQAFKPWIVACSEIKNQHNGKMIYCGGIVASLKEIITKKGEPMAFIKLEDLSGSAEAVLFPEVYARSKEALQSHSLFLVSAKVSKRNDEMSLLANAVIGFDEFYLPQLTQMLSRGEWTDVVNEQTQNASDESEYARGTLSIALKGKPEPEVVQKLRDILHRAQGSSPVCLLVESGNRVRQIETDYAVSISDEIVDEIAELVGRQNVIIT